MRAATACLSLGLALLTACQGKTDHPAPSVAPANADADNAGKPADSDRPPPSATAGPGILPEAEPAAVADSSPVDTRIVDVKLSDKGDSTKLTGTMTDQFNPRDGVFMSIHTEGTAGKYTLSSKWLTPTGDTLTEYSQAIATANPTDTIFSLSKPDGWAKGQYKVELSINGKPLRTVPFTVH